MKKIICPHCGKIINQKMKYYELQVTPDRQIFHNTFYTETELNSVKTQRYIKDLKNGEYYSRFVHLIEINEKDYFKYKFGKEV